MSPARQDGQAKSQRIEMTRPPYHPRRVPASSAFPFPFAVPYPSFFPADLARVRRARDLLLPHGYFLAEDEHERRVMKPYPTLGLRYISS